MKKLKPPKHHTDAMTRMIRHAAASGYFDIVISEADAGRARDKILAGVAMIFDQVRPGKTYRDVLVDLFTLAHRAGLIPPEARVRTPRTFKSMLARLEREEREAQVHKQSATSKELFDRLKKTVAQIGKPAIL